MMIRIILFLSLYSFSSASPLNNCYCGQNTVPPQDRILGGHGINDIEEAPFYAGIIVKPPYPKRPIHTKIPMYAGVIVSDRHILTSAFVMEAIDKWHQIPKANFATKLEITVGGNTEQTLVHHEIESVTLHPNVARNVGGPGYYANDSAIIKLKNPLTFSTKVQPICLPSATNVVDDDSSETITAEVVGFGDISSDIKKRDYPDTLQKAKTTITLRSTCENALRAQNVTDQASMDTLLCTVKYTNSQTACVYDNGGAIAVQTSKGYFVAGLIGWPFDCLMNNKPGVHTRVSSVVDFINDTITSQGGQTCPVKNV